MNPTEKELLFRLNDKLDEIRDNITDLKIVTSKQEENLKDHMKRTQLLEEQVDVFKKDIFPVLQSLSAVKTLGKIASFIVTALYVFFKFKK